MTSIEFYKKVLHWLECIVKELKNIASSIISGTSSSDYELGSYTLLCDISDPNTYYLLYAESVDGVIVHKYIVMPAGTVVTGNPPVTATLCKDAKVIQKCWKVQTATGYDYYTEIICLVNGSISSDIYLNHQDGTISGTKPLNAEVCDNSNTISSCDVVKISCQAPSTAPAGNYYTATNPQVKWDVINIGAGLFHIGIEDGAYTGAFGLFSSNLSSDVTRIFDDTYFLNQGVQLLNAAISNVTSMLGGRRIEFDYDTNLVPADECRDIVQAFQDSTRSAFTGTTGGNTGYVAFVAEDMLRTTTTEKVYANNVKIVCNDDLKDIESILWAPMCIDGSQWFAADIIEYNITTGTENRNRIYKKGVLGTITSTQPSGSIIKDDYCNCDKKIIGVERKYLFLVQQASKVWTLLSKYDNPHPDSNLYGPTFTYIGDNVSGTHPSGPYSGNGINGWKVFSVISDTVPQDDSNGHYWIEGQPDSFGTFTFNRIGQNLELIDQGISCTEVELVKWEECDGTRKYEYLIENGSGALIPATALPGWNEDSVTSDCPAVIEKTVCGTIDGNPQSYYLNRVYVRNPFTGDIIVLRYEDNYGMVITGQVDEVECSCSTLCTIAPVSNRNSVCFGYAACFNGADVNGDKITSGADYFIDYLEVDGNVVISTPTSIGSITPTLTFVDMGYGLGFNKIVDLINANSQIQSADIRFVTALYPNAQTQYYDPMGYGIEYNNTRDVRIVLREFIPISGATHIYSFRLNPNLGEVWDCLNDARLAASWNMVDVSNFTSAINLSNCQQL